MVPSYDQKTKKLASNLHPLLINTPRALSAKVFWRVFRDVFGMCLGMMSVCVWKRFWYDLGMRFHCFGDDVGMYLECVWDDFGMILYCFGMFLECVWDVWEMFLE